MTKFTPPTTFPHECLTVWSGHEVTLWAPADDFGGYPATITGCSGKNHKILTRKDLMDKPVVTKRWFNIYADGVGFYVSSSRQEADESDENARSKRLYVIREETCDGEITIHKEDV